MNDMTDEKAASIFAMATSMLLDVDEGICVEFEDKKYVVSRSKEEIKITDFEDEDMINALNDPNADVEHGSKFWIHCKEEEN